MLIRGRWLIYAAKSKHADAKRMFVLGEAIYIS
jgi:hypothetical protein